jgi:uncharacterized delta-60 repeat protein
VAALGSLAGAFLLLAAALTAPVQAAPGALDPTFSGDGKQTTDFGFGSSRATATVLQPDGKIVAAGGTYDDFALARYDPNGTLDPTFSGDGQQTADFSADAFDKDEIADMALQADGKIVVVGVADGFSGTSSTDFALARYNPNGTLDTSFSGDGKQTTDFGGLEGATGLALQANGKIVVVGGDDLARYNPNGSLDTSFSGDGKQAVAFSANGVALQPNGRIVVVGDLALARYNPDGSLDTSFSGDGRQTIGFRATGVALQGDGKIVVVGGPEDFTNDFELARYNPDGTLDTSFSDDGRQTTDFLGSDGAYGVALQGDGRIVVAGVAGAGNFTGDFALARYDPDGALDTSFSGDGKQTTDFAGADGARGVVLQGDGKIVAVGFAGGSGGGDLAISRYDPSGALDPNFSGDGKQTTKFGGFDGAYGVAVQSDGKIVAAGGAGNVNATAFALTRYNPDGTLDTSFSGDGKQATDFGANDGAHGVALQANGKIVAVGRAGGGGFAVARYNPNGTLDTTFSGDGKQTAHVGSGEANAVALQPNGKIVVAGSGGGLGTRSTGFVLARLNPNGSLDTTFAGDGIQTTGFGNRGEARGVAIQGTDKIVAVGFAGIGNFALARYNTNGSLDPSFSGDGKQTTDFSGGSDFANGVALQGDGRIVAAGSTTASSAGFAFALARYHPNGSLDTTFSGDGKQTTGFGGVARGVALQGDGKIVAVGSAAITSSNDFALARYNPNGTLDTSFSGDGKQTTDFGGRDEAKGLALRGGKIVAVGGGFGTSSDFELARYLGG